MPLVRALIKLGRAKAITLPTSWLQSAEENKGKKIVAIAMEVDGSITLNPVFEKEPKASVTPRQENHASLDIPTSSGGNAVD
jgi:antitoxin component of MazEF toxin-antitoxin module